jgi:hypothetical protein
LALPALNLICRARSIELPNPAPHKHRPDSALRHWRTLTYNDFGRCPIPAWINGIELSRRANSFERQLASSIGWVIFTENSMTGKREGVAGRG